MTPADRPGTGAARPGAEARAGRFPGPSLIPELNASRSGCGWLPREELEALARDTRRPLYEIEGLVSFYPHFRTEPPPPVALHVCRDLSCWLRGPAPRTGGAARAVRRRRRRRGARGVLPGPLRHRAGGGRRTTGPRAWPAPTSWSGRPRRPAGAARCPPRPAGAAALAQRPLRAGGAALPGAAGLLAGDAERREVDRRPARLRAARHGWRRLPDRAASGRSSRPAGHPAVRRSATPTSPSRAPSRTGRSSPSSRTWCWRDCCSGWSSSARSRAGCSSGTSTAPRRPCSGPRSRRCAPRGCSGTTSSAAAGTSRSRCSPRRAATSSARSPR